VTSYLLSVHAVDHSRAGSPSPHDPGVEAVGNVRALTDALDRDGALVCGGDLQPAGDASLVLVTSGVPSTTFGPAVAGPEQLAAFWVIDVDAHQDALAWAGRAAAACRRPVELRQLSGSSARTAASTSVGGVPAGWSRWLTG